MVKLGCIRLFSEAKGIDWPGTVLFTAALVSLTFSIARGPQDGWASLRVLSLLGSPLFLLGAFVAVERRRQYLMLDIRLFRYPRFIGVQLLPVATVFSFIALIVYVPIWFITAQGRDAFTAGLAIVPLTEPMLVLPLLAGRVAKYVSPGLLSGIGFLISALGTWLLTHLSPNEGLWSMALPMLLVGIGNGLPWGLMDALSVSVVPKARAGMAAGIFTTMRVAGEAIAITAIGAMLVSLTAANMQAAAEVDSLSLPKNATEIVSQMGARAGHGTFSNADSIRDGIIIELANNAYTSAFHSIFVVLAMLSALTAMVCLATLREPDLTS